MASYVITNVSCACSSGEACADNRGARGWLGVVAVVGVVGVLRWVNRAELPAAGRALAAARGDWLLVGTLVLVLWWVVWLLLYLACRRLTGVGRYAEALRLAPVVVGAVALNLAVKSGGLAGLALFALDGRRRGTPVGRVTGAYVLAAVLADVAFVVTLGAAVVVVWVDGQLTHGELGAVGGSGGSRCRWTRPHRTIHQPE